MAKVCIVILLASVPVLLMYWVNPNTIKCIIMFYTVFPFTDSIYQFHVLEFIISHYKAT